MLDAIKPRRPKVNVGTIGHIDHGKTTLTAALIPALRNMFQQQETTMQEAQPDQVKIAIVGDGFDTALVRRVATALTDKGYQVVDKAEDATHVIGKEGIEDFAAAERRQVKIEAERTIGRNPWMKASAKKAKKAKMKDLQRRAFTGE